MRKRFLAAAASAVFALTAMPTPVRAQSPSGQDLTPEGRGAYVALAGATDLYTVRAAEAALENAQRPEVRTFAQTMLTDHRGALQELEEVARSAGLEDLMPPGMLPMHWEMLRDLDDASAARFDQVYVDQQIVAHEIAAELHRNFAANGRYPSLKQYAAAALPIATSHLEGARRLDQ
jgi:putative membrane protein